MGMSRRTRDLVLVVDDDQTVLVPLCALLRARGFEVADACSADVALRLLDDGLDPDVILTDLSMPGHDGADLVDAVRAQQRRQRTAIVAMSASSRSLDGLRSKADAKLQKPFDLPSLLQALAHARAARPLAE